MSQPTYRVPESSTVVTTPHGTIYTRPFDGGGLPPERANVTRFVLLSDTHGHTFPVPDGDILLHAGNLTSATQKELEKTVSWLCSLPHRHKVIIAGNHDYCLDEDRLKEAYGNARGAEMYVLSKELTRSSKAIAAGLIYLQDESVDLPKISNFSVGGSKDQSDKSWRIWGSPWSAASPSMAFNAARGNASEGPVAIYAGVPDETEILITHGPPLSMLDRSMDNDHRVGCDNLFERLQDGLPSLKLHVVGHVHEDKGVIVDGAGEYGEGIGRKNTIFVNAANAGTFERPKKLWSIKRYQPTVIDLRNEL